MTSGLEQEGQEDLIQEHITKALKEECYVTHEDGGFLGMDCIELKGDGVETVRKLIAEYGDNGIRRFNDRFVAIAVAQFEKDERTARFYCDDKRRERYATLARRLNKGGIVEIIVPSGSPSEIRALGYDGSFPPPGTIISLQKLQQ